MSKKLTVDVSDIMSAAMAHYETIEIKEIVVPEWNDLVIYATPFNMTERKSLWKYANADDNLEFMLRTLILKALNKECKPLFTIADRMKLLHKVSAEVIIRIAAELTKSASVEEQEEK